MDREAKFKVSVERTGNDAAVREAAEDVRDLGEAAGDAAPEVDRLEKETEQLGDAASDASEDLDKASEGASKLGNSTGKTGSRLEGLGKKAKGLSDGVVDVADAFTIGFDRGTQFRNMLGDIDELLGTTLLSSMDAFITKTLQFDQLANFLAGPAESATQNAQQITNILNILESRGITPVSRSLEELREQLSAVAQAESATAAAAAEAKAKLEGFAEGLGLSRKELDSTSADLAKFTEQFLAANEGIDREEFGAKVKGQIQGLLDSYRLLGAEVPVALRRVADSLGIVDSATESSLEKQAKAVEGYRSRLAAALGALPEEARANAPAIKAALAELTPQDLQFISPEARENFKTELAAMVATLRAAGVEIGPEIQALGAQVGLLVTQFKPVTKAGQEMGEAVAGAGKKIAGTDFGQTADQAKQVADAGGKVKSEWTGVGGGIQEAADRSIENIRRMAEETEGGSTQVSLAMSDIEEATSKAADASTESGDKVGQAFEDGASRAEGAFSGIESAASDAASSISDDVADAGDATSDASQQAADSISGIQSAATEIDNLKSKVDAASASIDRSLRALGSSTQPLQDSIVATCKLVDQLLQKSAQLQGGGASGPPVEVA